MLGHEMSAQMATWPDGFSGVWHLYLFSHRSGAALRTEASNTVCRTRGCEEAQNFGVSL